MASLYQRLSGKINTSRSFPFPPEASHLLGGQSKEEDNAEKTSRPLQEARACYQYQPRNEEEDVRRLLLLLFKTLLAITAPFPFKAVCMFMFMICVVWHPQWHSPPP
ncbi:hypothetical protein FKM82_007199 [Ascaphus truei]